MSDVCKGYTINHLSDTVQLYPNLREAWEDSYHAMHILEAL